MLKKCNLLKKHSCNDGFAHVRFKLWMMIGSGLVHSPLFYSVSRSVTGCHYGTGCSTWLDGFSTAGFFTISAFLKIDDCGEWMDLRCGGCLPVLTLTVKNI
jgi:hypothetical protein